ncbi:MAG TPA: ATP-binding protein [Burkholderiales bacterium]|nr:ATP-binding protein [Burkholderiales bacterium]
MRLAPRSLFSRLVLVLLAGLVVAQLVSFAIHMHERGELLSQASGMQSAQRIADIARFLDPLDAKERRAIVKVLSAPPLTISLDRGPLPAGAGEPGEGPQGALFAAMLRRFLGDRLQVVSAGVDSRAVAFEPGMSYGFKGAKMHGEWPASKGAMRAAAQSGISFVAQVRLSDGTLATFDSRQPAQTEGWPYRLLLSLAVLLAAVVAVSLVAVRWATRPLNVFADAADELGRNINRPPLEEKGPLEVARAARALNTMQARLASYIRDRTRVLAAMSHDLKTPVTRLRLRAELLEDPQVRAKFTRDLDEMESMVGATLDFLRGQETGEPVRPVDVTALLESLQADLRETGGQMEVEGAASKPYPGAPQALKRCIGNLVENAVKYGRSARVLVDDSDARLEIRIQDTGPGLPPEELEKVFEPFYRVEASRSRETGGTGLGLTIARGIAEGHGGSLALRNRTQGGLEAVLVLPRSEGPRSPERRPFKPQLSG